MFSAGGNFPYSVRILRRPGNGVNADIDVLRSVPATCSFRVPDDPTIRPECLVGAVQITPEHLSRLHADELGRSPFPSAVFRVPGLAGLFFVGLLKTKRP
jgi:hypothetical protein